MQLPGLSESPNDRALKKLNQLLKQARDARRPYDAEAWLNIAFFLGEQYTEWNTDSDNIRRIPRRRFNEDRGDVDETDLPRPVLNKIQHFIYTAHAETLQDKPSADVLPATDDYEALLDQDVNKAYLNYVMEPTQMNWDMQLSIATLWALITPSGWLKWVWDPVMQRPDALPVPFFDLAVDPYARQFTRARYAIHTMFLDPEQVEETFGVSPQKSDIGNADPLRSELLKGMGSAPIARGVEVHELWQRPTKKHPKGLYAVFTGSKLLKLEEQLPYPHLHQTPGGMLPFTQLGSLLRPDSMYYTSPVTALRPAQMVWNKFVAQAILIQENFAGPKWWIPLELDMKNMPNSSPRQILRGNAGNTGLEPKLIQPPSMPDASNLLKIFEEQMMHVVSVHEVSQGQVPGRVEAAKAIELLQTSDKGRYKHLLDTIDQCISIGWWQALMLGKEFDSEERQIMTYSREGIPLVKRWRKSKVDPGQRIRVVRMGGLGRTRAERQDTLLLLFQNGIIKDPDLMAELMDVPIPSFTNARANDMRMARAENEIMGNGEAVTPQSWENHAIHIREHNEYRKTMEFHAKSKEVRERLEYHVSTHEDMQMVQAVKQAKLMMVMQGAPMEGQPGPEGTPAAGEATNAPQQEPGPPPQGPAPPGAGG